MQKFTIEQGREGKERKKEGKVRESTVRKWEDPENEDTGMKKKKGEERNAVRAEKQHVQEESVKNRVDTAPSAFSCLLILVAELVFTGMGEWTMGMGG